MKKFLIGSVALLLLAITGFLIVATVYFKPFIKEQIKTQLANFGYENATIGDVNVGLYKSGVSEIDLKTSSDNHLGEISVTYWPQQLLNKEVSAIQISDGTVSIEIQSNGDVIAAGYRIPSALTPKKNEAIQNIAADTKKESRSSPLPFTDIIIKDLSFTITTPTKQEIVGKINDLTYNTKKQSAKGNVTLNKANMSALHDIGLIVKPDLAKTIGGLQGTAEGNIDFNIANITQLEKIPGSGQINLKNISLVKDDIKIHNLTTSLRIDHLLPVSIPKGQKVQIDKIQKSIVTLNDFTTAFGLKDQRLLSVDNSRFNIAGGTISTPEPFDFDLKSLTTSLLLKVESVDLTAVSQLLAIPAFNVEGTLTSQIPIRIKEGKVIIDQAMMATVLQSAGIEKLKEQTNRLLEKKFGNKLDSILGGSIPTTSPTNNDKANPLNQQQPADPTSTRPNVKNVLDELLNGLGQ